MKHITLVRCVALVSVLVGAFASLAPAQSSDVIHEDRPDIIRSFRLIPSKSTLEQSGTFAGFHFNYHLFGKFDIVTGFEPSPLAVFPPIYNPFAKFDNVRIQAILNHPAAFAAPFPLSKIVDLEELHGTFRPDEPRRIIFKGVDHQDQPFELLAVQRGRLLHLLGANRPQCCDQFYHYKIDALAHIAPYADFNLDGVVNRIDSDRLLANIGTLSGATLEQGDADADGDVDGDDFLAMQQQFGASVSLSEFANDSLADLAFATAVVPEPASLVVILSAIGLLAARGRTRR